MDFRLADEHQMLKDLVSQFVSRELMPLEQTVLDRHASGGGYELTLEERARIDTVSREIGLWGLDAPEDIGGSDLPLVAMVGVNEEMGKTVVPYILLPDSPNLRMLKAVANERQREAYLEPYVRGETISAIGISEPGAGSDPMAMSTRAVPDGADWILNGRKIWISRADVADFTIVMAVTGREANGRNSISAFLVDSDTPGYHVLRKIPMVGGHPTFEVVLEDCRIPGWKLLGEVGQGFAPMQLRLGTRRIEMASWAIGMAQRALDMMVEYAAQRKTFGVRLSERQTIQNWVADSAAKIHAARLMTYHCAWKLDEGEDARREISFIKSHAVEMAYETADRAMQTFGGLGMTHEMPLALMWQKLRTFRIFDGPTEVHNWVIARDIFRTRT
ncbi:acyl-CoA dehydrogenase [Sphingomonas panacis]|uniref:Medium-chain specific acyl-CoA dehydrogenase, mitochondrial n=1 Tax=Sphingomonas panacis TaxID=1560345 RepID=A0A1B3ZGG4_9SPHN|nr:acyl-CoA dehydrogenase [Sphingomonas panacis]AOH86507.1 acyl-CoA dehydrogenase [Sphingomonas panacis]